MRKHHIWLRTAALFQVLTGLVHAVSLFVKPQPTNDSEKQLYNLLETYQFNLGQGFSPTMADLSLALSSCFTMLYIFGGLLNWHFLGKRAESRIMKGVLNINVLLFGISFGLMVVFTFLPPSILTGLTFIFLFLARYTMPKY